MLEEIKNNFEKIQSNTSLSNDKKSIEYARLMTRIETSFGISPMMSKEEFEEQPKEVRELYLKISNARNI